MKLLFMVLHGDCPSIKSGEQPPKMALVKLSPRGDAAEFLCYGCQAKVRYTQKVLVQPKAVVESGRSDEADTHAAPQPELQRD